MSTGTDTKRIGRQSIGSTTPLLRMIPEPKALHYENSNLLFYCLLYCLRHNQAREAPEMGIQNEVKAGLLCYFEHVEMNVRILIPGKCDKLNLTGLLRLNDSFHSATFGKYS